MSFCRTFRLTHYRFESLSLPFFDVLYGETYLIHVSVYPATPSVLYSQRLNVHLSSRESVCSSPIVKHRIFILLKVKMGQRERGGEIKERKMVT